MPEDVRSYMHSQDDETRAICERLYEEIHAAMPETENKVWHGHPVWFLNGNPIVGFNKIKAGTRLMFWSGADFDEPGLNEQGSKFKDASITYTSVEDIDSGALSRWLEKSQNIQWDYKNLVKRKGVLERLK